MFRASGLPGLGFKGPGVSESKFRVQVLRRGGSVIRSGFVWTKPCRGFPDVHVANLTNNPQTRCNPASSVQKQIHENADNRTDIPQIELA